MKICLSSGIYVACLIGLAVSQITLKRVPGGNIMEGDTLEIHCDVAGKTALDYVKTVRTIGDVDYDIAKNHVKEGVFDKDDRYSMSYKEEGGTAEVKLTITDIQGRDSGKIGCIWMKDNTEVKKYMDLVVYVKPKSVEVQSWNDGEFTNLADDQTITISAGSDFGLGCLVEVEGTDLRPDVKLMLGDQDITDQAELNLDGPHRESENGYLKQTQSITLQYRSNSITLDDDDKKVKCVATAANMDPVEDMADLYVLQTPELTCDMESKSSKVGGHVMFTCNGMMNPAPTTHSWSWGEGDDEVTVTPNSAADDISTEQQGAGPKYTFTLHIGSVAQEDFHDYKLTVGNGIGTGSATVSLTEQPTTTTPVPTTQAPTTERVVTSEPTQKPDEEHKHNGNGNGNGGDNSDKTTEPGPPYETHDNNGNGATSVIASTLVIIVSLLLLL